MMFVDVALLVFIEEMQNPVYVGDIYVLVGDFVLLCFLSMLKTYEQHNEIIFYRYIIQVTAKWYLTRQISCLR